MAALVAQFSTSEFGKALGQHGEIMVDAAFPRAGMLPVARDAREYRGRVWTETEHDLDRIYERKGVGYGIEVKNTLDYIPRTELETKVAMELVSEIIPVTDKDAYSTARELARTEGVFGGISSGGNVFAALEVARKLRPGHRVVTVIVDSGLRYLQGDLFRK